MPQTQKPDRMFVIVAGNSIRFGLCVVIPISIEPDHLSTSRSILIYTQTTAHASK